MKMRTVVALWLASILFAEALSSEGNVPNNRATQILQGVGPTPSVDLNRYNLPSLDDICAEYKAVLVQKVGESETGVYLTVHSDRELYVDTVTVQLPRRRNQGLGMELTELAGGREDGLGITIVTGLVEEGSAEGLDILPGDSIGKISLVRPARLADDVQKGLQETMNEVSVRTECLGYDATVAAIQSLPEYDDKYDDSYRIELKRIRRKPKVKVNLQYPPSQRVEDECIELFAGENLRLGMLVRGVKLNDPLALRFDTKSEGNCGAGGLCRTCAVSVLQGNDLLNPQRVAEKQMLRDNPRWRLACKAIVGYGMKEGEMTIRVNPRQWD